MQNVVFQTFTVDDSSSRHSDTLLRLLLRLPSSGRSAIEGVIDIAVDRLMSCCMKSASASALAHAPHSRYLSLARKKKPNEASFSSRSKKQYPANSHANASSLRNLEEEKKYQIFHHIIKRAQTRNRPGEYPLPYL